MERVAIVVNSRYGQTDKIAGVIKQSLAAQGVEVHTFSVRNAKDAAKIDIREFDGIVVGAPVYTEKFPKEMLRWTKENSSLLNQKETGFFSVSGNAGDTKPEARAVDDMLLRKFLDETGLRPKFVASFGGCIHFTKYNFFIKWILKRISEKAHGPVDTSRDLELTDWEQVSAFCEALAKSDATSRFSTAVRLPAAGPTAPSVLATGPAH